MLGKVEILIVIICLLFLFYLVISLGTKAKKKSHSKEINSYLLSVRILIIIIGITAIVLWLFI